MGNICFDKADGEVDGNRLVPMIKGEYNERACAYDPYNGGVMKRPNRKNSNRKRFKSGVMALYVGMLLLGLSAWVFLIVGLIAWLG